MKYFILIQVTSSDGSTRFENTSINSDDAHISDINSIRRIEFFLKNQLKGEEVTLISWKRFEELNSGVAEVPYSLKSSKTLETASIKGRKFALSKAFHLDWIDLDGNLTQKGKEVFSTLQVPEPLQLETLLCQLINSESF